jgi:hypothetical protein
LKSATERFLYEPRPLFSPADFTSVNSFQEEIKYSSQSFYCLTQPLRPPTNSATFPAPTKQTPSKQKTPGTPATSKTLQGPISANAAPAVPQENFYAATDIVKVRQQRVYKYWRFARHSSVTKSYKTVARSRFFVNASPGLFLQTDRREQHFTPGRFTPLLLPEQTPAGAQESPVFEFPRHRLRLLEKLGEGAFGMVSSRLAHVVYCKKLFLTPLLIKISLSALNKFKLKICVYIFLKNQQQTCIFINERRWHNFCAINFYINIISLRQFCLNFFLHGGSF